MAPDATQAIVTATAPQKARQNEPAPDAADKPSFFDRARWVVALLVAVAATAYFLDAITQQNICGGVLAGTDASPQTVELCRPPGLLNLAPFGLVIAILLWPDLGEFGVTGLMTLKRRVREQETKQEAVETRLAQVDQHLTQLALLAQSQVQGQAQSAAATVNNYYAPDQEDVRRGIVEKERPPGPPTDGDGREERERLLGEFLSEYARLEPYILRPRSIRASPALERLPDDQRALVAQWNEVFGEELAAIRQTRNVAVHEPQAVSAETLRGAIANTRELARILFGRLGMSSPAEG